MADRREALKIIGAISSTCAFPFSADELYAQEAPSPHAAHQHGANAVQRPSGAPEFFSDDQLRSIGAIADVLIPATATPAATAAGVPAYVDYVVARNQRLQQILSDGLRWIDAEAIRIHSQPLHMLAENQIAGILQPLSDAIDARDALRRTGPARDYEEQRKEPAPEEFFRAIKSLSADGYYTSQIGLVDELGYAGNTALSAFPECEVPEH